MLKFLFICSMCVCSREKKAKDFEGKEDEPVKLQDLRLKEGQTIKINLGVSNCGCYGYVYFNW